MAKRLKLKQSTQMRLTQFRLTYDKSKICEEDANFAILIVVQADASVPRVVHVGPDETDRTKTLTKTMVQLMSSQYPLRIVHI